MHYNEILHCYADKLPAQDDRNHVPNFSFLTRKNSKLVRILPERT